MSDISPLDMLAEVNDDLFLEVADVLLRLADDVIIIPGSQKFLIQEIPDIEKVLVCYGGETILNKMGFNKTDKYIFFGENSCKEKLRNIRQQIHLLFLQVKNSMSFTETSTPSIHKPLELEHLKLDSECTFVGMLRLMGSQMECYEDPIMQEKALCLLPLTELKKNAININKGYYTDNLAKQLLYWFTKRFFNSIILPLCGECKSETIWKKMSSPNRQESFGKADYVELYTCTQCDYITRYPRYFDVGILLETRTGRMVEAVHCFLLFARAVGFEARYIVDFNGYEWVEVYSEDSQRWIHCDPYEGIFDDPLLYECHRGRNFSYIIAFSREDIRDVTWRYSLLYKTVAARRKLISEENLRKELSIIREELQERYTNEKENDTFICDFSQYDVLNSNIDIKDGDCEVQNDSSSDASTESNFSTISGVYSLDMTDSETCSLKNQRNTPVNEKTTSDESLSPDIMKEYEKNNIYQDSLLEWADFVKSKHLDDRFPIGCNMNLIEHRNRRD